MAEQGALARRSHQRGCGSLLFRGQADRDELNEVVAVFAEHPHGPELGIDKGHRGGDDLAQHDVQADVTAEHRPEQLAQRLVHARQRLQLLRDLVELGAQVHVRLDHVVLACHP